MPTAAQSGGCSIRGPEKAGEESIAVLFVDIDQFKAINDRFGHVVGDQLLVAVAGRLHACVRPTDTALSVFYDSAIRARTWLDPRPEESNKTFRQAVESVSSGRNDPSAAISEMSGQLNSALRPYQ